VPPEHYGGIERVIADLADGLIVAPPRHPLGRAGLDHPRRLRAVRTVGRVDALHQRAATSPRHGALSATADRFDLVHNFGRLAYLASILRWTFRRC